MSSLRNTFEGEAKSGVLGQIFGKAETHIAPYHSIAVFIGPQSGASYKAGISTDPEAAPGVVNKFQP